MTRMTSKETFMEIEKRWGISYRASRLYALRKVYPRPEVVGRTGYYDLEKTRIIERAGLIKILRDEFDLTLEDIKKILVAGANADFSEWRKQLGKFAEEFPGAKTEKVTDPKGKVIKGKYMSARSQVARWWFADIMKQHGKLDEKSYKLNTDVWKDFPDKEMEFLKERYRMLRK